LYECAGSTNLRSEGAINIFRSLETLETEFFDCEVRLSASQLNAQQLKEFASSQMPRTGIGAVPWSTPLSSDQLSELTEMGKAEFITAHMMLAADGEPPLIGIGALIRDPDHYPNPRMIIVVESESRGQGFGTRIANELLRRLHPGETVQVEVQEALTTKRRRASFFEKIGFKCLDEVYRVGGVPRYVDGALAGTVQKNFALYSFTNDAKDGALPGQQE
jgi:predicted GNAT family N-acyltransferase